MKKRIALADICPLKKAPNRNFNHPFAFIFTAKTGHFGYLG